MGNIKETIKGYISNLTLSIQKEKFDESERLYKKYKEELKKYNKEVANQIISILIEYIRDYLNIDIHYYITNLKTNDKINFLFNEVFEGILINSTKYKDSDIKSENDVKGQINKIEKIYKKVILNSSIIIIEEKLANLYFLLADIKFQKLMKDGEISVKSFDNIIKIIDDSIFKSRNSTNIEQIESYKNYKNIILNKKNKLEGAEYLKEKNYEKAIDCFKKINIFENIDEEKYIKNYIEQCYFLISIDYEQKKDYINAIEILKNLNQNELILKTRKIDLQWKIEYDKIENNLVNNKLFESIDNYYNLLENEVEDKIKFDLSNTLEMYYISFFSLLPKITLFSYKNDSINDFVSIIVNKNFKNKRLLPILNDLINFLKLVNENKTLLSLDKISESIKSEENINEIKQRIYIMFLIEHYYNYNKKIVIDLLNNSKINLFYISEENKIYLNNLFENEDDIDILYLFSNLYENLSIKGIDNSLLLYNNISQKLSKLINQRTNNPTKSYVETTKNFIKIYKNIVSKSNHKIEKPKQLLKNLLLNFPEIKLETCKLLCFFLSKNINIKLGQEIIIILIDFILSYQTDEITNIEDTKNEILNIIIDHLKKENLFDDNIIILLFKMLVYYGENESRAKKNQDKIIKYFLDINIKEEILTNKNIIKSINEYLELENYSQNIIQILKKIPKKFISLHMKAALDEENKNKKIKENKKRNVTKQKDNYQLIIEIKTSAILNPDQQLECESRLEEPEFYKQYLSYLKSQKDLFKTMNLEIISKKININNLELFYLICEKKKKWPTNALISLLNGFYQNDKNLLTETFKLFNLIENYQKLPDIIIKNIIIEKKLLDEGNYDLKDDDIIIYETMINDFNNLKGFCDHHKSFINQIEKLKFKENTNVYNNLMNLLVNKNFDIGKKAFNRAIGKISLNKFIDIYSKILSNPLILEYYKMKTLKRLDKELHSKEISLENIYTITIQLKYFIDWILIPPIIIETFLFIIKNHYNNRRIKKEIIFSFGNYFSILKENQKDLFNQFYELVQNDKDFQIIKNNNFCKTIKYDEYIFYIYSCFQYYENFDLNQIEAIPIKAISKFIFENQKENSLEAIELRINNYIDENKYDRFSPSRDSKLRQLFVSSYSKSLDYLEILK